MSNIVKKETYGNLAEIRKHEELTVALNQNPPAEWVKEHPFIKVEETKPDGSKKKVPLKYLPIERVEFLLDSLFKGYYRIEVIHVGMLLNAVQVTVRVHYKHPITDEWMFHDGLGCSEIQTTSGSGALKLDMSNINRGALVMAVPNAKSVAIKDACDHLGKLFGRNLNRKDTINYGMDLTLIPMDEKHPNWEKVCDAVRSGAFSIDVVKSKYDLTEEAEETLKKLVP